MRCSGWKVGLLLAAALAACDDASTPEEEEPADVGEAPPPPADAGVEEAPPCPSAPVERWIHHYDERGRLASIEFWPDGGEETITYDEAGRRTSVVFGIDSTRWTWDAAGRLTAFEHSQATTWRVELAYDDAGRIVAAHLAGDFALSGALFLVEPPEPDPLAFTRRYVEGIDLGEDRQASQFAFEAFDEVQGTMMVDWHATYAYGADGRRTEIRWDYDGDGAADAIGAETWDEATRTRTIRWSGHLDSETEAIDTVTYDEDGDVVGETIAGADGTVSSRRHVDVTPTRIVDEIDRDGLSHSRTVLTFDARGHRVAKDSDTDGDGTVDWRKIYRYDDAGRRTVEARDHDADGVVDQVWRYTYQGNLLVEEIRYEETLGLLDLIPLCGPDGAPSRLADTASWP